MLFFLRDALVRTRRLGWPSSTFEMFFLQRMPSQSFVCISGWNQSWTYDLVSSSKAFSPHSNSTDSVWSDYRQLRDWGLQDT